MSIVLLVAEKGSLPPAAKALNVSLPSISRKVNDLESHLGTKLMQRSTRKLTLTDSGEKYVQGARRILEQLDDVERAASGEYSTPRGELVLTAPVSFGQLYLLPLVTDFLAMYPEINVQLMLSDRNLHFLDDRVDMAVRLGTLPDSNMVATRVGSMETLVCASPDLVAAHGAPKHPRDLQMLPCVVFTGPATTTWTFREPADGSGFGVDIIPRSRPLPPKARSTRPCAARALPASTAITVKPIYGMEALRECFVTSRWRPSRSIWSGCLGMRMPKADQPKPALIVCFKSLPGSEYR